MKHFMPAIKPDCQNTGPSALKASNSLVGFSRVCVSIEGREVLADVNLEINKGEKWAIVGPNGSGKTTLLRIINGYLRPSSGMISFRGKSTNVEVDKVRAETGFVSAFLDNLIESDDSVLDVVVSGRFGATRLWEVPDYESVRRARRLMRQLGCKTLEDRRLSELSQGERQRVLIARAMMPEPVLLTLDEPCASLDLGTRESFLRGLETIAARYESMAMIYVTHRIDEIPKVFDHALLLRDGRILASGKMSKVMNRRKLSECFAIELSIKKWKNRFYPVIQD